MKTITKPLTILKRKVPRTWLQVVGIWPDRTDPIKYQRRLRRQYAR